jgi:hypothetical protein
VLGAAVGAIGLAALGWWAVQNEPGNIPNDAWIVGGATYLGIFFSFIVALAWCSSLWFKSTTCLLVLRRQWPRNAMEFLEDAHRRGVLRQVGAAYRFRHVARLVIGLGGGPLLRSRIGGLGHHVSVKLPSRRRALPASDSAFAGFRFRPR